MHLPELLGLLAAVALLVTQRLRIMNLEKQIDGLRRVVGSQEKQLEMRRAQLARIGGRKIARAMRDTPYMQKNAHVNGQFLLGRP